MAEQKVPVLDIPTKYSEIGNGATLKVSEKLSSMGLKVQEVIVENISLPNEVEKAIDERSSMSVIGNMNTYTQYKAAGAIETAAGNPGGLAGAGIGIGAGFGFGGIMSNAMGGVNNNLNEPKVICPSCNNTVSAGKFCPECGKPLVIETVACIKCGSKIKKGSKFCPECGESQIIQKIKCPKCGVEVDSNTKFCPECGEKLK